MASDAQLSRVHSAEETLQPLHSQAESGYAAAPITCSSRSVGSRDMGLERPACSAWAAPFRRLPLARPLLPPADATAAVLLPLWCASSSALAACWNAGGNLWCSWGVQAGW